MANKTTAETADKTAAETAAETPSTTATSQTAQVPDGEDDGLATPSATTIGVRSPILMEQILTMLCSS